MENLTTQILSFFLYVSNIYCGPTVCQTSNWEPESVEKLNIIQSAEEISMVIFSFDCYKVYEILTGIKE